MRTKRTQGKGQHGQLKDGARPPEHAIWKRLIQKCCNPNNAEYKKFGGRGIRVCERWLAADGFVNFLADVGPQPFAGAGLRRLDPDGDFEAGNVRWGDTRTKHLLTYDGRPMSVSEWARERGMNARTIRERMRRGWPVEAILTQPLACRDHLEWYGTRKKRKLKTGHPTVA